MRGLAFAALALATASLSACTEGNVCGLVAFSPPINVHVRDQDGAPQALGADVWFASRSGVYPLSSEADPLTISGGEYGVTFDIEVSKRYYATSPEVHNVLVPGNVCAGRVSAPIDIPVVITLLPGSPPVRSLNLFPQEPTLDRGHPLAFNPIMDASPGADRSVRWRLAGNTQSIAFDSTTGVATYVCRRYPGLVILYATSVAAPWLTDSARITIAGHPTSPTDPPCS